MIRLENVHKHFGRLHVLRGINLEIRRGEKVCVVGPSGSGKSTLLRVINHLEPIDDGTIFIDGKPVYEHRVNDAAFGELVARTLVVGSTA